MLGPAGRNRDTRNAPCVIPCPPRVLFGFSEVLAFGTQFRFIYITARLDLGLHWPLTQSGPAPAARLIMGCSREFLVVPQRAAP